MRGQQRVRKVSRGNRRPRRNTRPSNIFKRRVQNVSNRPTLKPRKPTFGNLAINTVRRLIAYPARQSKWWIDELTWKDNLPLQLHTASAGGNKSYTVGCGSTILFSTSNLLATSPICVNVAAKKLIGYEQARIMFIRATVTPIVNVSDRSGLFACAIVPIDSDESTTDASNDFKILSLQPNSVVRPMTRPISVSWSPTIQEHAFQWEDIKRTKHICALMVAFSDMALVAADSDGSEYNPAKAGFEILIESRIEVRRPGTAEVNEKLSSSNPRVVQVMRNDRKEYYHFNDLERQENGGFITRDGAAKIIEYSFEELNLDDISSKQQSSPHHIR